MINNKVDRIILNGIILFINFKVLFLSLDNSLVVNVVIPISLPIPIRNGYIFDGWFTGQNDGTQIDEHQVITEDVTFVAKWTFSDYTAMIGTTGYETLDAAIAAVPTTNVKTTIFLR